MKKSMFVYGVFLSLLATAAFADNDKGKNTNLNLNNATAVSASKATAVNVNSIKTNSAQKQSQAQSVENSNNANQAVNFDYKRNPVSTAIGPSMSPSAQCMGVASGGAQGVSLGLSFGKSYESKPCNQRELARMFAQLGDTLSALEIICSMEGAEVASGCVGMRNTVSILKPTENYSVVTNPLTH